MKPEESFQSTVIAYAKLHGWKVAHFRKAMTKRGRWVTPVAGDGKGFPDLLMVRGGVQIAAELKVPPNKPTPEQIEWLEEFRLVQGCYAFVWTPGDWSMIEHVLGHNKVC